ncbi:MAG: YqjF family protein [Gemmatimonadota bacterium]
MHELLSETAHRPWPLPTSEWIMEQTWRDLLFAHWPYPVEEVRAVVPGVLPLDTFDGRAWVGVVPFKLENLRARGLPAIPGVSSFPELNVRTYVTLHGKPGVYFFSLDAANPLAVLGARTLFHLNYYNARMRITATPTGFEYTSRRTSPPPRPARFRAHYAPLGEAFTAAPGTLDHFLTERYCLYAVSGSRGVSRLQIHHRPWLLQPAQAEIEANELLAAARLAPPAGPPLLHFAALQPMIGWAPQRL